MKTCALIAAHPRRALAGDALHLLEPISFWGGVSPIDGTVSDPASPHFRCTITDKVVFIRALQGSSSSSSVLLELIYRRVAPAAIVLDIPDAILALGAIVSREMGWATPALLSLASAEQDKIGNGARVHVSPDAQSIEVE